MKWPKSLTLIRHDESAYNALKKKKEQDPLYQEFKAAFEKDHEDPKTRELALKVKKKISLGIGDHNTPLSKDESQAETMAKNLKKIIELPDIIFVSPYERTLHTLERMKNGWPELARVRTVEESRIREQEHGLVLTCNDWRIFQTLYPEQRELHKLEGKYYYRFPQGESVEDVRERTRSWFNTLTRDFAEQNVLAVTHHLTILAVRANLERLSAEQFIDLDENQTPINCGVTVYKGDPKLGRAGQGKLILDTYNAKLY